MNLIALRIVQYAWIAWVVFWFVAAFRVKKMRKREPAAQRFTYLIFILLAVASLSYMDRGGALDRRWVPHSPATSLLGAALTVAGIAFSIWARVHIGQYWSGSVALREGHQLIRTGPYARIRHPIYTGILFALAGTALAVGNYRALATFATVAAGLILKAKREESLLAGEFGAEFEEHRRYTGFFFPRFP